MEMKLQCKHGVLLLLASGVLSACGGGGGGSNKGVDPPPPAVTPPPAAAQVRLTVDQTQVAVEVGYGEDHQETLSGNWSASNLAGAQVYLQVSDADARFAVPSTMQAPTSGEFELSVTVTDGLKAGVYSGTLVVRACSDQACAAPYPSSAHQVPYALEVLPLAEWSTYQGNARHDGYVPISLDSAKFKTSWKWIHPGTPETFGGPSPLNAVATQAGKVFVTDAFPRVFPDVHALDGKSGGVVWSQQIFGGSGDTTVGAPAAENGKVYLSAGAGDNYFWTFDAETNSAVRTDLYQQDGSFFAPTAKDGHVFLNVGFNYGEIYALDGLNATRKWSTLGGTSRLNTPAVHDGHVYSYSGSVLTRLDQQTGSVLATSQGYGMSYQGRYYGAPIVGSSGMVVVLEGNVNEQIGGSWFGPGGVTDLSAEPSLDRALMAYRVSDLSIAWKSLKHYRSAPAVAKGVIYATSNSSRSMDALSETTGELLWSWAPPASDSTFHRNVVVTKTHAFVSTDKALYAVDLKTHQAVWERATPGMLSISSDKMLYVVEGVTSSVGSIQAYQLD